MPAERLRVLFPGAGNSCRSQMAEALAPDRRVRDEIRDFVATLPDPLMEDPRD